MSDLNLERTVSQVSTTNGYEEASIRTQGYLTPSC